MKSTEMYPEESPAGARQTDTNFKEHDDRIAGLEKRVATLEGFIGVILPEGDLTVVGRLAALEAAKPEDDCDPDQMLSDSVNRHKRDLAIRASERQRAAGIVSNHIYGYPGTITDQLHKAVLAAILDGAEAEDAITQKVPSSQGRDNDQSSRHPHTNHSGN